MAATTPTTNPIIQFNPASQLPIKLIGSQNFTTWKAQIAMLMHGHDLYGHLDGTTPAPSRTITQTTGEITNPQYKIWFRQDQLIQNALMASVDPTIASTVAGATSSKRAWDSLHTLFANKSQTRIFSLRHHLTKISKDAKSIAEYLREIRSVADELATAGSPISNEELIVKILSGLGPEFREISAAIRARDAPITFEELFDKLLDHELFITHEDLKKTSVNITAAVAQKNNTPAYSRNNRRPNTNQPWRQIPARDSASMAPNMQQQWRSFHNSTQPSRVKCQLCDKIGHVARVCRSRSHNHFEAKANFVSSNNPWILDSGATHHVTTDSHGFQRSEAYHGPDDISMGDGLAYEGAAAERAE